MKRIWLILFLSLIVFVSFGFKHTMLSFSDVFGEVNLLSYSVATYNDFGLENYVQVGDLRIYTCSEVFNCADDFVAQTVELGKTEFENFDYFKKVSCVMSENVCGFEFKYLYDKDLPKRLYMGSVAFNLQVAIVGDMVKIGYPCIVDSI